MPTSEITPTSIKIDKLISRIEDGDIKIPAFQRGFVWDEEQVIELLDMSPKIHWQIDIRS